MSLAIIVVVLQEVIRVDSMRRFRWYEGEKKLKTGEQMFSFLNWEAAEPAKKCKDVTKNFLCTKTLYCKFSSF